MKKQETAPLIRNRRELREHLRDLYVIEPYLESVETYTTWLNHLMMVLIGCFRIRVCREYPIKFKITPTSPTHEMQFKQFVINVSAWCPFINLYGLDVLDDSIIITKAEEIRDINEDYINNVVIKKLRECNIGSKNVNKSLSALLHNLRIFSLLFSIPVNINFSIPTFIQLYEGNPRIKELMDYTFSDDVQPYDVEQKLNQMEKEFINIVSAGTTHLGVILRANTGMKHKQLREFAIADGLKPNIVGKTIPLVNSNSILVGGLNTPSKMYNAAGGARKSLVLNKTKMGNAGYFGKKLSLLSRDLKMSTEVLECDTKHYVTYDIKDGSYLKKLNGKYMIDETRGDELHLIDARKDKHLIGQKIRVRSVCTCACEDGYACPRCVGNTSIINFDIADGVGAFESEEVSKHVEQNILSTKHLLNTISEKLEWNKEFFKFFTITSGEIYPRVNDNEDVSNIEDWAIRIAPSEISRVEDMDEDSLYNTYIDNGRFVVVNLANNNIPPVEIYLADEKEIYISPEAIALMRSTKGGYIKFKDLDDDVKLFEIVINNNELTKPLYDIMHLLDKSIKDGSYRTIDFVLNRFLELLVISHIPANVIAAEMIVANMIHAVSDPYSKPDFSEEELEHYEISTVSRSLEHNRSPLIGISYQNLQRQLTGDEIFGGKRNKPSYVDSFYNEVVKTASLKKYSEIIKNHDGDYVS